ncbi:hypothetical protein [Iodidimonas sp. SYSU 1G8]|uniref:hypothetical protein n=1 Tax=Iodidimonas sp. SYSU 1G8 TaxID=3133967 RepID=UPI0031FE80D3
MNLIKNSRMVLVVSVLCLTAIGAIYWWDAFLRPDRFQDMDEVNADERASRWMPDIPAESVDIVGIFDLETAFVRVEFSLDGEYVGNFLGEFKMVSIDIHHGELSAIDLPFWSRMENPDDWRIYEKCGYVGRAVLIVDPSNRFHYIEPHPYTRQGCNAPVHGRPLSSLSYP